MSSPDDNETVSDDLTEGSEAGPVSSSLFAELKRRKVFRVAATYAVVAWLIIQVASATFSGFGIPTWAFRFVVLMLVLGFPISLIITWAFELTPSGIKLTKSIDDHERKAAHLAHEKKRNWTAFGFAAGVPTAIFGTLALYFYIQLSGQDEPQVSQPDTKEELPQSVVAAIQAPDKSIAVLPFHNRSNLDEDQFFTDGIHDDLLTQISRIRDIKTISRTSVMAYRDTTKNIREIGEELGVAHLLEGGVQRAGNRVRINMQLIDAQTDAHLWAETYTRELTAENIFEIQSEIAVAIARELKAILSEDEQQRLKDLPTQNLEALEAYFKGLGSDYSSDGLRESVSHFSRAIELDPSFAQAHARLAHVYQTQIWYGGLPAAEQIAKSRSHLERAMELDPNLSDAWVVKGLIHRELGELDAAEAAYKKAIELNPNSDSAYTNYTIHLFWDRGDAVAALETANRAINLNPEDPNLFINKAEILESLGRDVEAMQIWHSLNRRYPNDSNVQMQVATNLADSGADYALAIKSLRKAHFLDPENLNALNRIFFYYMVLDSETDIRFWLERGIELYPDSDYRYIYEIYLLILDGELEQAHERWLAELAKGDLGGGPLRVTLLRHLTGADFNAGVSERALERYRLLVPTYFEAYIELPTNLYSDHFDSLSTVVYVARALELGGERERGREMLSRATRYLETHYPDEVVTFVANAYLENWDRVIELLTPIYEDKVGGETRFEGALWEPILDKEPLAGFNARYEVWRKEMLEDIATMEANGELAPLPQI